MNYSDTICHSLIVTTMLNKQRHLKRQTPSVSPHPISKSKLGHTSLENKIRGQTYIYAHSSVITICLIRQSNDFLEKTLESQINLHNIFGNQQQQRKHVLIQAWTRQHVSIWHSADTGDGIATPACRNIDLIWHMNANYLIWHMNANEWKWLCWRHLNDPLLLPCEFLQDRQLPATVWFCTCQSGKWKPNSHQRTCPDFDPSHATSRHVKYSRASSCCWHYKTK